ncbi:EscU/YscU/HrcU family type III secretion system export apparatus switch protein [Neobacillus sp. SM06]|uniref:EscU/YscU/HrcU family type III secretion system export apparatus switch protein n=1 Tax=Neobacillus sp. SM06 TaxID=3422492 RepID=UPI003D2B15DA
MSEKRKSKRLEAVALSYQQHVHDAPKVIAKGKGKMAETIIEKAKQNQIPIQEDPSLVQLLAELNLNQSIPEELYQAVAEIFAFIYQTDRKAATADQKKDDRT